MVSIFTAFKMLLLVSFLSRSNEMKMEEYCKKLSKQCHRLAVKRECPQQCGQSSNRSGSSGNASSKKKCDKRSPCVSMKEANGRFQSRCQKENIEDTCQEYCRYNTNTQEVKQAFIEGDCSFAELRTYLTAASNGKDNSACCRDTGVTSQRNRDKCTVFCNPTGPVWPDSKGEALKLTPCIDAMEGIMKCHYYSEEGTD